MLVENRNRKVIPRWRDFATTVSLGELSSPGKERPAAEADATALLERRYSDWIDNPTIWHAADVLNAAVVLDCTEQFRNVAEFVVSHHQSAPAPLVRLAEKSLAPHAPVLAPALTDTLEQKYAEIHALRQRAAEQPRNAILWVDLSRLYVLVAQHEQARNECGSRLHSSPRIGLCYEAQRVCFST